MAEIEQKYDFYAEISQFYIKFRQIHHLTPSKSAQSPKTNFNGILIPHINKSRKKFVAHEKLSVKQQFFSILRANKNGKTFVFNCD